MSSIDSNVSSLTRREKECLHWASLGKTVCETAVILNLSEKTVRHYLDQARFKLDASNITHAVSKAIFANLICNPGKFAGFEMPG